MRLMADLSELYYIWNAGFEVCSLTVQGMFDDYIYSSRNLFISLPLATTPKN